MEDKDLKRNEPTEKGRDNDPNIRDESAVQPGISTMSDSSYDEANQELTRTAADDFRTMPDDDRADKSFDEPDTK